MDVQSVVRTRIEVPLPRVRAAQARELDQRCTWKAMCRIEASLRELRELDPR